MVLKKHWRVAILALAFCALGVTVAVIAAALPPGIPAGGMRLPTNTVFRLDEGTPDPYVNGYYPPYTLYGWLREWNDQHYEAFWRAPNAPPARPTSTPLTSFDSSGTYYYPDSHNLGDVIVFFPPPIPYDPNGDEPWTYKRYQMQPDGSYREVGGGIATKVG